MAKKIVKPSIFQYLISFLRYIMLTKRLRFGFIGSNSIIYFKRFEHGKRLNVGSYCKIDSRYSIGMRVGDNFTLRDGSIISSYSSAGKPLSDNLLIGNNVGISENCFLQVRGPVVIGNNVIIGPGFKLISENHSFDEPGKNIREQKLTRKGVQLSDNIWAGANVTVLDGVEIGSNSVIAAGAVVTKSFPKNVLIGGIPAKVIKELSHNVEE